MTKIGHFILTISCIMVYIFSGCASSKPVIKATSPNCELVEAEGMAPMVGSDIQPVRKTSLEEAMKSALGLVIGVYVSQEALVSKAILIEDNITSQTEGYIEKYDIIKEWRDGDFYKTRIRALVRKEDLSAKIKALELEPKRLGNPIVRFSIEEFIDGTPSETKHAENELKTKFVEKGFVVSDSDPSDIIVSGKAETSANTSVDIGGLISYRAAVSVNVMKSGSKDVIAAASETMGGVDVTAPAAAKTSISNGSKKIAQDLPDNILKYLRERSTVQIRVTNVENINKLNDFVKALRALIEVRDCKVRDYSDNTALIDSDLKKGTSSDLAKRLETMSSVNVKVNKIGAYDLEAELLP